MPDPISGIGAAVSIGGSLIKGNAAKKAARQQTASIGKGIAELEDVQSELRDIFQPFITAGGSALNQQLASLGLLGPEAQTQFVQEQEQSPIFQALTRQGEEAMLQQAAATGGLRGGNLQGALAQYRPSILNQFLERRYDQLGGISSGGLTAATGLGTGLVGTAESVSDLFTQQGAARAGGTLGKAKAMGEMVGTLGGIVKGLFK